MDAPFPIIAHIENDLPDKFGIPRQSNLVPELQATIVFTPAYRDVNALRGLDGYSHIWLLWQFSENLDAGWQPTVRPPKLGGNIHMGVFATRSPFRPCPIGLSCVRLEKIVWQSPRGPLLLVSGADLMNGTPIYDIKPYLPATESHPEARGGFASDEYPPEKQVEFPQELLAQIPAEKRAALFGLLAQDPRPGYQHDPARIYGLRFAGFDVRFRVAGEKVLVCAVERED